MFSKPLLFIALLGAALSSLAETSSTNAPTPTVHAQPPQSGEFRGAWIHSGYGIQGWDWDQTVGVLKSNGFNAIFPNLVWAGTAHFPSKLLPVNPRVKEQGDQIAACLAACRKYGIELHVWKVNCYLLHAPREFVTELRAAGRTQKNRQSEEVNWLCPSHPDNFALERDSMLEVARDYEVDGIHFDYIRYPDREACFCAGCRERFAQHADVSITNWPDDVLTGEPAAQFADWRREQITRLVRAVSQAAHALKPKLKVSAAVWGGWANARQSIGQDAQAWIDAGYLDFVCPMNYETEDEAFAGWTRKQVDAIQRKTPLYIGIGAYRLSGPEQLARQIQLSRELGADGFVLFQLNEKLATQLLPALRLGTASPPPDSAN